MPKPTRAPLDVLLTEIRACRACEADLPLGPRPVVRAHRDARILIVDDEADIRDLVAGVLDDEGHRTRTAGGSDEALAAIESRRPHLVFLDIWLQ